MNPVTQKWSFSESCGLKVVFCEYCDLDQSEVLAAVEAV
jgi:hypothetical protein